MAENGQSVDPECHQLSQNMVWRRHMVKDFHTGSRMAHSMLGENFLDAEIRGCSMLLESVRKGGSTSAYFNVTLPLAWCIFCWNALQAN